MSTILIRGARPYGEAPQDILIERDRITQIADPGVITATEGTEIIEAEGLIALPGLVDVHVHLREPGFESSETVLSGSRAAAKGGFTTVFAMPNTRPVQDSAGVVETVWALGREAGYADVHPIGAVTVGQAGEQLAELGSMADSRAAVRMFSDDGLCIFDPLIMRRALEYVKAFDGVIAQHAQDPQLTRGAQMNEGALSAELGLGGWPEVAETSIIARDALLAEQVDSRVHVCHLSTATAVDVVRWAKARGIKITAEVTPHHLLLTEEKVRGFDARFKVNPPLRTEEDVVKLREALADGTIDVIGTDHAPHPMDSKQTEWDHAAMGMVGLESALRIVHATMVNTGLLDWRGVARVMSEAPAQIGSATDAGRPLQVGELANIVLYDETVSSVFSEADLAGKSVNSPYLGLELPGSVEYTIFRGTPTLRAGTPAPAEEVARASRTRIAEGEHE
ncbi:MAG: dihydroorotase [Gulosibacter sp.]|uniref:dihydroorotase n=1 Tax=Gulosibacter sp. TaxID=2817531 RepID=UPI003F936889